MQEAIINDLADKITAGRKNNKTINSGIGLIADVYIYAKMKGA